MIYVLAYPDFPPTVAARIDAFRAAHEPQRAERVRPHVTVVFGLRSIQPQAFIRFCHAQIGSLSDFAVTFDDAEIVHDPFESAHKLVLTCTTGCADITALQRRLYDGPHRDQLNRAIPYRPHMTVATNQDRSVIDRLDVKELTPFPPSGAIRTLDVVEQREDNLVSHCRLPLRP